MTETGGNTFDRAYDGTAYWTLSLYVDAERLGGVYNKDLREDPGKTLRAAQLRHHTRLLLPRRRRQPLRHVRPRHRLLVSSVQRRHVHVATPFL